MLCDKWSLNFYVLILVSAFFVFKEAISNQYHSIPKQINFSCFMQMSYLL